MATHDDGDEGWVTLTEIARRLGRSLSTVTSRRTTWREHLDERPGPGRQRRYRLDAFLTMDHLMASNADHSQIQQRLDMLREVPPGLGTVLDPIQGVLERLVRIETQLTESLVRIETDLAATRALLARVAERLGLPDA